MVLLVFFICLLLIYFLISKLYSKFGRYSAIFKQKPLYNSEHLPKLSHSAEHLHLRLSQKVELWVHCELVLVQYEEAATVAEEGEEQFV